MSTTPQILISGTIAEATTGVFEVRDSANGAPARVTLFAAGLAGSETATVSLVVDGTTTLTIASLVLAVATPIREITAKGRYVVSISSSAGAVKIGVIGAGA